MERMKAVVLTKRGGVSPGRIGDRPAPLWPLPGGPMFEHTARILAASGIEDVLFLGQKELAGIHGLLADGRTLGVRLRYRQVDRGNAGPCVLEFAGDHSLLVLTGNTFLGGVDLTVGKRLLDRDAAPLRGVHHSRYRPYQEEVLPARSECRRSYMGGDRWDPRDVPAELHIVPAEMVASVAADLTGPTANGLSTLPSIANWVDFGVFARRITSESAYFELTRALLLQSHTGPNGQAQGRNGQAERVARPDAHIGRDVVFREPVSIGPGAVIEDGVRLYGPCLVGALAVVGRGATVVESIIWPGAEVAGAARVVHSIKFRTMVDGSAGLQDSLRVRNLEDGPQFKIRDDPRVTPVGQFARITNIDELPQLWHVLRGEMSIVRPRPSPERDNQFCPAWREARLSVRPGITGLWQVCRSEEDRRGFHEWIQYDIEYVASAGWRLDAWILWRTLVVVARDGLRPIWSRFRHPLRSRARRRVRRGVRRPDRRVVVPLGDRPAEDVTPCQDGVSARHARGLTLLTVLRIRWRLVLAVTALIAAPTATGAWLLSTPEYQATRSVWVRPVIDPIVFRTPETGAMSRSRYQSFRKTQADRILERTVLASVLDEAARRPSPIAWLSDDRKTLRDRLASGGAGTPEERLLSCVEAEAPPESELLYVRVTAPDPEEAAFLADAVIDAYMDRIVGKQDEEQAARRKTLADERDRLRTQRRNGREQIARTFNNLPREFRTSDMAGSQTTIATRLQGLADALTDAKLRRAGIEARIKIASESEVSTTRPAVGDADMLPADVQWRRLRNAVAGLEQGLKIKRDVEDRAPRSRDVVRLETRLEAARAELKEYEAFRAKVPFQPTAAGVSGLLQQRERQRERRMELHAQLAELEIHVSVIAKTIEEYSQISDEVRETARSVQSQEQEIAYIEETYQAVMTKLQQTAVEQNNAPARIEAGPNASVPSLPSRDRRLRLSIACLFGAFAVGLALAFFRERADKSFKDPADLRQDAKSLFLGVMSKVPDLPALSTPEHTALVEETRIVRTSLLGQIGTKDSTSLLITSCEMGSGKTTLSAYLASSLAEAQKRVLLVDADLRRRDLSKQLGLETRPGLAELLASDDWLSARDVIEETAIPMVHVVPAGVARNGNGLLANGDLPRFLAEWTNAYDVVLLDGPPMLAIADAQILAGLVDATVLCLRASHTRQDAADEARRRIHAVNGTLVGAVLNGLPPQSPYYYYSNYGGDPTRAG